MDSRQAHSFPDLNSKKLYAKLTGLKNINTAFTRYTTDTVEGFWEIRYPVS